MIAIIDYGVGNIFSLSHSLNRIGADCVVTNDQTIIKNADKLILPGVGAFEDAAKRLEISGMKETIIGECTRGKPLLGICLGMQLLFEKSYEYGEHTGLGLLEGEVVPLRDYIKDLKIPHMGWNSLDIWDKNPIFKYIKNGDYVYFVHSYFAKCAVENLSATAPYGINVTAAVRRNNIFGVQFHPEKSGDVGLKILKAFNEV